jgi:hypothetical protein
MSVTRSGNSARGGERGRNRRRTLAAIGVAAACMLVQSPLAAQGWIEPLPGRPDPGVVKVRTNVSVRVTDRVAIVEVEEWFRNGGGTQFGEGDYLYPHYLGWPEYRVAHKTGDWPPVLANDVGIVYTRSGPIVIAFCANAIRGNYGEAEDHIGRFARKVVEYYER